MSSFYLACVQGSDFQAKKDLKPWFESECPPYSKSLSKKGNQERAVTFTKASNSINCLQKPALGQTMGLLALIKLRACEKFIPYSLIRQAMMQLVDLDTPAKLRFL